MKSEDEMRFIRLQEVLIKTSIPKSTLMFMVADGEFPAPIDISARSRAWLSSEVTFWMKAKIDERDRKIAEGQLKNE